MTISQAIIVNGPRAGALEFRAGFDAGTLLKALRADDHATLRQLITWPFVGEPAAFMAERSVRVEAGWPKDLADDDIRFSTLGRYPTGGGRWLVGRNERGHVPTIAVDDVTPHWLFSGTSGSGKSTAMTSAVAQLARDETNRFILIDVAKLGASFKRVAYVRGRIGPVCGDIHSARAALSWAVREMAVRYGGVRDDRRLIVCIDELQQVAEDAMAAEALKRLVEQGRGIRFHVLAATQHPTIKNVGGPSVARNFAGRFALRVMGAEASRVAVGGKHPRADNLLGRGDAYVCKPGAVHRCQVAWFDEVTPNGEPSMREWPDDGAELSNVAGCPTGPELGAALLAVNEGNRGRVAFQRAMTGYGMPVSSNDKAVSWARTAGDALDWLDERGYAVRPSEDGYTHESSE